MTFAAELRLALRLLLRDHRAGELILISIAVIIAVASVTSIGFFTDRVQLALGRQANLLLGADLVLIADRPLLPEFEREARRRGLNAVRMTRFPSMLVHRDDNLLTSVKSVTPGYPLRGEARIAERPYGPDRRAPDIPAPGTVWVDERLATQLELGVGDSVTLGATQFQVAAILTHEPDSAIGFLSAAPRVHLNESDLAATRLIQPGSRVRYRLQLSGPDSEIEAYRAWALPRLQPGQRLEGIRDARPEVRSALERAEKYLNLAALLSVVLATVAIALCARRFLQRHLDGCAMMRCLGASQAQLMRLYVMHFIFLGTVASIVGCVLGMLAQLALSYWLSSLAIVQLPAPGWRPGAQGLATGLALLLAFALPPLVALSRVPTLRVLRRELGAPGPAGAASYALAFAVIAALILWKANDLELGLLVLGCFVAAIGGAGAVTWLLILLLSRLPKRGIAWRFGIGNLRRHTLGSVVQVVALAIGIMALLTLTLIRGDLLKAWETSLPPQAPNRFIINIQPEQLQPLEQFFALRKVVQPPVYPMVRGRLVQINERPVSSASYEDDRARRLVDREFNLSWTTVMPADNRIVSGQWWGTAAAPADQFSVESGIAKALGVRLGDVLRFDIAGETVTARVTSLRSVDWDSFNVNFFVVAPPGLLERYPATYITSFYLAPERGELLNALVQAFPNFLLIDIARIMAQVQRMMDQVARAVQFVFLFTLLAGLVVLYAAVSSTLDERLYQATIMRTLGASRMQITRANLAEFASIGALAGLLAAAGANALGMVLASRVLNLDYGFNAGVWIVGIAGSVAGIAAAGYFGTRAVVRIPPLKVLQRVG
ncbi:MAG: ABC transporter permease [Betaproteobacteria bacterium]